MKMFNRSILELGQPEGTVLFNLAAFSAGPSAVLDRISDDQSGIYAWFRSFNFQENPDLFADELVSAIRAPKLQTRTGDLVPYYEISLKSKSYISSGKEASLRQALKDDEFQNAMRFALRWSILFQAPLYVGKSGDLRSRIDQHLKPGSPLRERLFEAKIDIEKTYLLIVPTPLAKAKESSNEENDHEDLPEYELLFEEVFSRLFNPAFTIRLG